MTNEKSQNPIDRTLSLWYTIIVKGEGLVNSQSGRCFSPRKYFLKKVKNPLTNQPIGAIISM
jgi:hypothetical protein